MGSDLKDYQYRRMLEERRGHNYQYPNHEQQEKNSKLGYKHHIFRDKDGKDLGCDTRFEDDAIEVVENYRNNGYFARIVCYPNRIVGMKYYSVIYRKKKKHGTN